MGILFYLSKMRIFRLSNIMLMAKITQPVGGNHICLPGKPVLFTSTKEDLKLWYT